MIKVLDEVGRTNLVGKTKAQSKDRYRKRLDYRVNSYNGIDAEKLLDEDLLVTQVQVGDYYCTIAYNNVLKNLIKIVSRQPKHNVTLQSVIRAVTQSIDDTDIFVDCSCPDFVYRYAYAATQHGYKYGKPENRPSRITNPDDNKGAMCKHLTMLLANKRWMVKLASIVNDFVKANIEEIRDKYKVPEDEFFINISGRPSRNTGRNTNMTKDYRYGYSSDYSDDLSDNTDDSKTSTRASGEDDIDPSDIEDIDDEDTDNEGES